MQFSFPGWEFDNKRPGFEGQPSWRFVPAFKSNQAMNRPVNRIKSDISAGQPQVRLWCGLCNNIPNPRPSAGANTFQPGETAWVVAAIGTSILEVHGERMIKRTFDPGFRIEPYRKDLDLALISARQVGLSLPNTAAAQELFNACAAHGGKAWDHSALVRALEIMANYEIGAPVPQST